MLVTAVTKSKIGLFFQLV